MTILYRAHPEISCYGIATRLIAGNHKSRLYILGPWTALVHVPASCSSVSNVFSKTLLDGFMHLQCCTAEQRTTSMLINAHRYTNQNT